MMPWFGQIVSKIGSKDYVSILSALSNRGRLCYRSAGDEAFVQNAI